MKYPIFYKNYFNNEKNYNEIILELKQEFLTTIYCIGVNLKKEDSNLVKSKF